MKKGLLKIITMLQDSRLDTQKKKKEEKHIYTKVYIYILIFIFEGIWPGEQSGSIQNNYTLIKEKK